MPLIGAVRAMACNTTQQIVADMVAADQQHIRIAQTACDRILVGRELFEHAHTGDIVQLRKLRSNRLDHRIEYGRHYHQWQVGTLGLRFIHLRHTSHTTSIGRQLPACLACCSAVRFHSRTTFVSAPML